MGYDDNEVNRDKMKKLSMNDWNKLTLIAKYRRVSIHEKHPKEKLLNHLIFEGLDVKDVRNRYNEMIKKKKNGEYDKECEEHDNIKELTKSVKVNSKIIKELRIKNDELSENDQRKTLLIKQLEEDIIFLKRDVQKQKIFSDEVVDRLDISNKNNEQLEYENKYSQSQIRLLKKSNNELVSEAEDSKIQITNLKTQMSTLTLSFNEIKDENKKLKSHMLNLETKVEDLVKENKTIKSSISDLKKSNAYLIKNIRP